MKRKEGEEWSNGAEEEGRQGKLENRKTEEAELRKRKKTMKEKKESRKTR